VPARPAESPAPDPTANGAEGVPGQSSPTQPY
jgi:hypothetical protein